MRIHIIATLLLWGVSNNLYADDINVQIFAAVKEASCNIQGDPSIPIILSTMGTDQLANPGSFGLWKKFDFKLSACPPSVTTATITFSGTPSADGTKYLNSNTGSGAAKNVEIELQGSGGEIFSNGKNSTTTIGADGTGIYSLRTRMYSTAGGATDGSVKATIVATMIYQ